MVYDFDGTEHDAASRFTIASHPRLVEPVGTPRQGVDVRQTGRKRRWPHRRLRPAPVLTITVEPGPDGPEVHLHAGGQGFWVAHLAATLGSAVTLCCALGGEPGRVLRGLIEPPTD